MSQVYHFALYWLAKQEREREREREGGGRRGQSMRGARIVRVFRIAPDDF